MKFLVEWSNWNPSVNKDVLDFIEKNKIYLFTNLCDKDKSDEENMKFLINYFTQYPDEMNSIINPDKIKTVSSKAGLTNSTPILMNIGGVMN